MWPVPLGGQLPLYLAQRERGRVSTGREKAMEAVGDLETGRFLHLAQGEDERRRPGGGVAAFGGSRLAGARLDGGRFDGGRLPVTVAV
ncbi:hypothetical protein OHB41_34560 [Streptomyces sp. NBC_01571]|nr:hypothetical protein [Streptomyces sp. NBC_01571]MCX4578225.1 hypothetical protein [Streptomyces sp. NBC_01571]